jgi:hypothetical protein
MSREIIASEEEKQDLYDNSRQLMEALDRIVSKEGDVLIEDVVYCGLMLTFVGPNLTKKMLKLAERHKDFDTAKRGLDEL